MEDHAVLFHLELSPVTASAPQQNLPSYGRIVVANGDIRPDSTGACPGTAAKETDSAPCPKGRTLTTATEELTTADEPRDTEKICQPIRRTDWPGLPAHKSKDKTTLTAEERVKEDIHMS
ncbi:hypothetical protein WMY93_015995 [Mugilogobius chulae]|uniref:Prolactin receptor n=1 Tax=Mugilogobius chulae TaxID=88201 RepID=A0AAW0NW04_9GOBI